MGCRARGCTSTLVRVVAGRDGWLAIDRNGPGRGAWLCKLEGFALARPECIALAQRRRAFARALRRDVVQASIEALFARAREHASMEQPTGVPAPGAQTDKERG
ncbi:MAG: DUF448 domain-containing protein [Acidimicrobiales bacterium]